MLGCRDICTGISQYSKHPKSSFAQAQTQNRCTHYSFMQPQSIYGVMQWNTSSCLTVIECEVLGGKHARNMVLIPRIPLSPSSTAELPFDFRRTQFPIGLAFAMTINKPQGHTQPRRIMSYGIGIYPWPIICCCFTHYRWHKFEEDCSKYC